MSHQWLATYGALILGWDTPILEALSAWWRWATRIVHTAKTQPATFPWSQYQDPMWVHLFIHADTGLLKYVSHPTLSQCEYAVRRNGWSLEYVPLPMRTPEICMLAVCNSHYGMRFVPTHLQSTVVPVAEWRGIGSQHSIAMAAVLINGMALQHVAVQTPDLCWAALHSMAESLQYVREQTPEMCAYAVSRCPWMLPHVRKPTLQLQMSALRQYGFTLKHIPDPTPEMCLTAVQRWGEALEYVPVHLRTLEVCQAAVLESKEARQYVPDSILAEL